MRSRILSFFLYAVLLCISSKGLTQNQPQNLVYIDPEGVLRWTKDKKEASFFGVNYTVPFAYGYRSHKALGVDIEKAIDADVYHFWRLGLNAFRVHVWDVEISDSLGNLLQNEHLRLFDYLIKKLKERNIKILVTPIAFWGNGYPEPDEKTMGFSSVYGKNRSVVLEAPIRAQENYLKQFMTHVNPYTGLSYKDDPDIIAAEVNNEPHHSGPKEKTTEYINRMIDAIRSTGWTKPVFYNISESPFYADAVTRSKADGYSFQWYPTGLVKGHELKGNFLPHVDQYQIPFRDTIPAFSKKPLMVYEFDAGDVMQPIMYPAMARSFRQAGFQWATQFAYDPMATAYANTEYQTHYLNLAYTPSKAISLLIASKVFQKLPRRKNYGKFPGDTLFDVFRVSYEYQVSEMNSDTEFYYTNSTATQPRNPSRLKHIAGVGISPLVYYSGTGAYFLDQLEPGIWRLELMPDAVSLSDPFEKAAPSKTVTGISWQEALFRVFLPDLDDGFLVFPLTDSVSRNKLPVGLIMAKPGVYLLCTAAKRGKVEMYKKDKKTAEFYAPKQMVSLPIINHQPIDFIASGQPLWIGARMVGIDTADKVSVEIRNTANKWKTVSMERSSAYDIHAEAPAEMISSGMVSYRIIVRKENGKTYTFPGGREGNPYAWDNLYNDTWNTYVIDPYVGFPLFIADRNRREVIPYNPDWSKNTIEYVGGSHPGQLVLKASTLNASTAKELGFQYFFGEQLWNSGLKIDSLTTLVVKARSAETASIRISLITADDQAFSGEIRLSPAWTTYEIPLHTLRNDSLMLLPRPYPGFRPLKFKAKEERSFEMYRTEKLEITLIPKTGSKPESMEIEAVWIKK